MTNPTSGPSGWPLIGHLPAMANDPLGFLESLQSRYGDVVRFSYGDTKAVLISHPDAVAQVFLETGKQFHKGYQAKLADRLVLGNGLVNSEGSFWRQQRKLAQPAFHAKRIGNYADTMVSFTLDALNGWQDGEERKIHEDMMLLTQRIVVQTLFGQDTKSGASALIPALDVLLGDETFGLDTILPDFVPTPGRARLRWAVREINTFLSEVIRERRETPGEHNDLLSMLLEARDEQGQGMSEAQLLDEMRTLYLAGHETTSNTMTFVWLLLSQHHDVRDRIEQEVQVVLGGRLPALADLRSLTYLDAVVKEAMRLYPPVWAVARVASEDVVLGDHAIPKGTQVILSEWIVHRDARWFPEPLSFRPDRWLDEADHPRYAYFPFGGGPRICIGNTFAQMEAILLLTTIAQQFRLNMVTGDDVKLQPATTLRIKGGLKVVVNRRDCDFRANHRG